MTASDVIVVRTKYNKPTDPFYYSRPWRKLRIAVLQRDNYLCVRCLAKYRIAPAKIVHHIKPRQEYPELELEIDNLESLCNGCHEAEHPDRFGNSKKANEGAVKAEQSGVRVIKI